MNRKKRWYILFGGNCLLASWLFLSEDQIRTRWCMLGAGILGLILGALAVRLYQPWKMMRHWSKQRARMPDLGPNGDDLYIYQLMEAIDRDRVLFWLLPHLIYIENDARRTKALRKAFFRVLRKFHKQNYMSNWKNPSRARLEKLIRPTNNVRN